MKPKEAIPVDSSLNTWKLFNWSKKLKWIYILFYIALILSYIGLALIPAPDKQVLNQYHLSTTHYHLILYPVVMLLVVSWTLSLIGSINVKNYSALIKNSKDGAAFSIIGAGFMVLATAQPLNSLAQNILGHVAKHAPHLIPTLTIVINYSYLIIIGISLILLAWGADRLYATQENRRNRQNPISQSFWVGFFIIFSAFYAYFIVIQPLHTPLARRAYYLPDWLLVSTIAVPYLFFWYRGLNASYRIYLYQRNIHGRIYKQALIYLSSGIAVVIASSIFTRIITTISSRLSQLSLTPLLFIVYALIAINGIGFLLITIGANKLSRIEEA